MVNRRSFKSDVSFLEKISMGATGTIAVFNNLREQGHTPIELERGSRSFKIWKNIKIIGTQDQQRYIYEIEQLKTRDPEVYFAVRVLWKIMTSWIYRLEEY